MKLMFASDIHGSALWCEKMILAYRAEGAEKLCLLGDILYHGPRNDLPEGHDPKGVISMLNALKEEIICVRGNCDTEVDQMVLDFPVLADYLPPLKRGDVLINGHTHIFRAELVNGVHCLNDGSVSLPKENNPHSYMVYQNGEFTIKDFEGRELLKYNVES